MPPPIAYRVSPVSPHEHLFEVEGRFDASASPVDLWMPVWTPGSYLVREFARHVQELRAFGPTGERLPLERVDKATWRVTPGSAREVVVRYRVYANELTVRTSHLDGSHGYFNGANLFVTSDVHRARPCELRLDLPAGWRAFCALPERDGALQARSFDELIDSPVEMGPHEPLKFDVAGRPHEVVIWGRGNFDPAALVADLRTLCETEVALFGKLPPERYLFILHLTDKARGGLEHAASCTLAYPRFGFRPRKAYEDFLALVAHEYFHLWNVKRITPRAFVPFDYRAENYTRLLWAMEGFTSYYDTLVLRRAGLIDANRYLERLAEAITSLETLPARRVQPLDESSMLAWIKHYRPDENTPNSAVSYYVKGEIVAALLDLRLREASGNARSLDDVMRALFERYGDGSGVPEDGVEAIAREFGGEGLRAFFDDAVHRAADLDYSPFATAGLALKRRAKKGPADKGGTADAEAEARPWLGVDLRPGERAVVSVAYAGSPATEAGLYPDDEIVALDGFRVTGSSLAERLADRRPGEVVRLTLFRRDELLDVALRLGARPLDACFFERLAVATPAQRARFEAWLGERFDATTQRS